ncbi:MAG: hypothetical protein FWG25_02380 [Promicromonosporaceae bacterium]|nr:hypothetical protein [Promicromonosporaceae bacterium]
MNATDAPHPGAHQAEAAKAARQPHGLDIPDSGFDGYDDDPARATAFEHGTQVSTSNDGVPSAKSVDIPDSGMDGLDDTAK